MTKSELIEDIASQMAGVLQKDVEIAIDTIFDTMRAALANRDRIEIRGFGVFIAKARRARGARNPRTGQKVSVPQKYVPFFTVGKELRDRINGLPLQVK